MLALLSPGLMLCHHLLTLRLELGGLVGAGPFSSGSAEALAGVARVSLLVLLANVLAVPLPFSLTAFTRLVVSIPSFTLGFLVESLSHYRNFVGFPLFSLEG